MSTIEKIMELRCQLQSELAHLHESVLRIESKIEGIDSTLAIIKEDEDKPAESKRAKNSKAIIIDILNDRETDGASVIEVIEIAQQQGFDLKRDSTSSQLSRLKNDGVAEYSNGKYYLREFYKKSANVLEINSQKSALADIADIL